MEAIISFFIESDDGMQLHMAGLICCAVACRHKNAPTSAGMIRLLQTRIN